MPVALAFVAMFASAPGQSFLLSVFVNPILAGVGINGGTFSAVFLVATVLGAGFGFGIGPAAEILGLGPMWSIVALGLAVGCGVMAIAHGVLAAAVGIVLLRTFGQVGLPLVGTLIVSFWCASRPGAAMAVASGGFIAATVALPPLLAQLILAVGWRATYWLLALALAGGVAPLGAVVWRMGSFRAVAVKRSPGVTVPTDDPVPGVRVGAPPTLWRSVVLLVTVLTAPGILITALSVNAVSLLGTRGISAAAAPFAVSALGLGMAAGMALAGPVADRLGTRTLLLALSSILTAGAALLFIPRVTFAYVGYGGIGLADGVWAIANGMAWVENYDLDGIGTLQGLSFGVQTAAMGIAPLPLVLSVSLSGSYTAGLACLLAVAASAVAAAMLWRAPSAGYRAGRRGAGEGISQA
jgi:hypothetical protein